jgi:hypothetical protein
VLVLRLDLHGFQSLDDEVPMLPTPIAHAQAPPSVLPVCVHALEPPAQQREILFAQHVKLLIWQGQKTRKKCLEDMLALVLDPDTSARL